MRLSLYLRHYNLLLTVLVYYATTPEHGFDSLDNDRVWVNGFVGWYKGSAQKTEK